MSNLRSEECCGCLACKTICPNGAIKMAKDENGFIIPRIEKDLCVDCGLCERVCKEKENDRTFNEIRTAYSLVHANKKVLRESTSGGAFSAISDYVISTGGVVFASRFDSNLHLKYYMADNSLDRDKMRGSRYVQSDMSDIYEEIEKEIRLGRLVLFVGSPCQVAGIKSYLSFKKDINIDNLVTLDFICHGVPNNNFFLDHIQFLEHLYGGKIVNYTFRDKKYLWLSHGIEEAIFEDGKKKSGYEVQIYNSFFQNNTSLRESCFLCKYRGVERVSDFTMADFWGVQKITGKKNRKGVSLLTVNSDKAEDILKNLKNVELETVDKNKVLYRFSSKKISSPIDRDKFWQIYRESGYPALVDKYKPRVGGGGRIRLWLKKILQKDYFVH